MFAHPFFLAIDKAIAHKNIPFTEEKPLEVGGLVVLYHERVRSDNSDFFLQSKALAPSFDSEAFKITFLQSTTLIVHNEGVVLRVSRLTLNGSGKQKLMKERGGNGA